MVSRAVRHALLALLALGCAGAPAPRRATTERTELEGLDVSRALDPLAIECAASIEGTLGAREERARSRWEESVASMEAGRNDEALEGFMEAYCMMEGHPHRGDLLYRIAILLQDLARYRASYEALRRAAEEGGEASDHFGAYRVFYLRAVLRRATERLDAGDPPFALCGANDRPSCSDGEECLRDYARFNAGFCPTLVQLDESCPGVCVPEHIVREEGR